MGNRSLSIKFAFVLSLSLSASYSSSSPSSFSFKPSSSTAAAAPKQEIASATDLLSLLGTKKQSSTVNPKVAEELKSCFKFLVPFSPNRFESQFLRRRSIIQRSKSRRQEDELIWWPPEPVRELARLAFDSDGDPAAIHRALDPTVLPVPDIQGSKENRCELTRTPYGRHFINKELNAYLEFLFELIAARGPFIGLNVSLNRYDLFHGHLFIATDSGRLGILFHAKEYPAYENEVFPYNMGYCQIGSNVRYDDSMNLRNILWLAPLPSSSTKAWVAPGSSPNLHLSSNMLPCQLNQYKKGVLVVLDARPGGIIYRDLIPEYVNFARTIYEEDFGDVVVDVNYLNVGGAVPDYQIFIC